MVSDFKINSFESMTEFRKWMRGPKTNNRGMTRHIVDIYESIVSAHIIENVDHSKQKEAKAFSEKFKGLDQRDKVKIKVGNKIAVLSSTIIPEDKISRIELSGFINPKKIVKINLDLDNKIDSIEFADGSRFPEAAEFTTVAGKNITNTIFFPDSNSSSIAYTSIWMWISNLEGNGWKLENYMAENLDADQKRAGQLGPTEKVGPKGAVGKLVGN
jgi:hypothetical protein